MQANINKTTLTMLSDIKLWKEALYVITVTTTLRIIPTRGGAVELSSQPAAAPQGELTELSITTCYVSVHSVVVNSRKIKSVR
jgi:hypothetical protein